VNENKESARGFGSKMRLKNRPDVSLSSDYVLKEKRVEPEPAVERPSDALPSRLVPSRPLR
jgi:hypothetical protein